MKNINRFLVVLLFLVLTPKNSFSQAYPITTIDFGWINRTYYSDINNNTTYDKSAVGNLFTPCKMTISVIDLVRMKKSEEEKTFRFGDYIGLQPIYGGGTKLYSNNQTTDVIGYGTGFYLGAFMLYHFKPHIGVGFNVKWDVSLDAIYNSKSFYSYYVPLIYYSLLAHYNQFSLQFSTSINAQPRTDNAGFLMNKTSQVIELKYLLGSKVYLVGSYEILNGNFTRLSDDYITRKDRFNSLYLGLGFKL